MKRGKDEDKTMGPMFPRLHVNDTEKGGPRAPPRNKMALYEQLSIPSQRFNGGVSSFNPNTTANSIPPSSSTPGPVNERGTFSPIQQSSSMHPFTNQQRVQQQEHKRRQEDDDFTVPIFDQQSGTSQYHQNRENENERITKFNAPFSSRLANVHNARQTQNENSQDFARSASNQPHRQNPKSKVPLKVTNESTKFRDYRGDSQADNSLWGESGLNEASKARDYENTSVPLMEVQREASRSPNNGDAVSETSMVDSICGVDISPDDVVGIIGQKHFWKARRAIVNQQRVFAVQVFELHRLIKVQRLIAGSPHLLFEESAYLSKPPKATTIKKIPLEYIIKPKNQNDKNALEKPNDETEFSAENLPGKASLSSVQNGSQTSYCQPFSGNPVAVPPPGDMGPWNYNPPPGHGHGHGHGHQWLIPVMSPSEGLVYKPYPGPPGFMNPVVYGGPGPGPMMGHNFGHYGVPPSDHHYESPTGVHPFAPPASHGYFPSYNMPPVNHPVNTPVNSTVNPPVKITATKHSEVQASTASSRSDRTRNRNALPLFPTSPPVAAAVPVEAPATSRLEVVGPEKEPPRVIRVVPHNARSATASVARIFRSIQEERKQCGE